MPPANRVIKYGFNLPNDIIEKIKRLATRGNISRSAVIHYALDGVGVIGKDEYCNRLYSYNHARFIGQLSEEPKRVQLYGLPPYLAERVAEMEKITNNRSELIHHAVRLLEE